MRRPRPYPDPRRNAGLDPAWPEKVVLRKHIRLSGYDLPEGNVLHVYLQACEQHLVTANTAVVAQLLRRARMLQPLPYQRLTRLDRREDLLDRLLSHLDVAATGSLPYGLVQHVLSVLNPLYSKGTEEQAAGKGNIGAEAEADALSHTNPGFHLTNDAKRLQVEDLRAQVDHLEFTDYARKVDGSQFLSWAAAASAALSLPQLRQAVLELLSYDFGLATLEPAAMFALVFRRMDVSDEGFVTADELRSVLSRISPAASAEELAAAHPALILAPRAKVTQPQFVDCLVASLDQDQPKRHQDLETAVRDVLEFPTRPGFVHDFSCALVGDTGVVPLLAALRGDLGFAELRLRQSGLGDAGCSLLCQMLEDHPRVTSLDVSCNPIGSPGGAALARLLQANTNITTCNFVGIHLMRPFSRTHYDSLGPAVCEDGEAIRAALLSNQAQARGGRDKAVALLRSSPHLIRSVLVGLGDKQGKVAVSRIRTALRELAAEHEWNLADGVTDDILQTERLVGAGAHALLDSSGELSVGYGELMRFIRSEAPVLRVAIAIRHHLAEVKAVFLQLAVPPEQQQQQQQQDTVDGPMPLDTTPAVEDRCEDDLEAATPQANAACSTAELPAAGSGGGAEAEAEEATADLEVVRGELIHLAGQPSSGWEVALTDLESVLQPSLFKVHYASGVPSQTLLPGRQTRAASDGGEESSTACLITWPQFINTLFALYQRLA